MTSVKPMSDRRCEAAHHTDVHPSHGCRLGSRITFPCFALAARHKHLPIALSDCLPAAALHRASHSSLLPEPIHLMGVESSQASRSVFGFVVETILNL